MHNMTPSSGCYSAIKAHKNSLKNVQVLAAKFIISPFSPLSAHLANNDVNFHVLHLKYSP